MKLSGLCVLVVLGLVSCKGVNRARENGAGVESTKGTSNALPTCPANVYERIIGSKKVLMEADGNGVAHPYDKKCTPVKSEASEVVNCQMRQVNGEQVKFCCNRDGECY